MHSSNAYQFMEDESYLHEAYHIYESMKLFAIDKPEGKAIPRTTVEDFYRSCNWFSRGSVILSLGY